MADSTMILTQIEASQAQKEVTANGLFDAASPATAYGRRAEACSGLTWGYYGTRYGGDPIANGTNLCNASETTYMMVDLATGAVAFSNEGSDSDPAWDDPDYARTYIITTGPSSITSYEDHRFGPRGIFPSSIAGTQGSGLDADASGFRGIPQNSQTVNYTTVAADAGKHVYHPSGGGSGDTFTIASNASVAYEVGTAITFVNMDSNAVSIAIASDTLYLAGSGTTGTRTLAQYGVATAVKLTITTWLISGTGLT